MGAMGIEFMAFNHTTKTQVDLSKGPFWLFHVVPELKEAHPLTIADELCSQWGRTELRDAEFCAFLALHLYVFFRTGKWEVPDKLPEGPVQPVDVFSDSGDAYLKYADDYPVVGERCQYPVDVTKVIQPFFSKEDILLILACSED